MGAHFTLREGAAFYGLLAKSGSDIFIKCDRAGFIEQASPGAARLGFAPREMLIAPHIADLAAPGHAAALRDYCLSVIGGESVAPSLELELQTVAGEAAWYVLTLHALHDKRGASRGAIGILRSIDDRRRLEERLFAAAMTDPLTGLANRRAFTAMLRHLVRRDACGSLALFSLDQFRALNLRHGASEGDRLLVAFAGFLREGLRRDHIVARIGDELFAALMPADGLVAAEDLACDLVEAISSATRGAACGSGGGEVSLSVSAGVARLARSGDDTLQRAELALVLGRARGANRVAREDELAVRPRLCA
ncbi:MAG: GGDEF domain-containing protein [Sphingomonadales bacterium]|nr:GGDEF domain-containing protein [Sphingomonadales bacterium]MBD3773559.1 GGDEF domain-containing protein [Paracoccaceae bacterium]